MNVPVYAIVLAAGQSRRFGSDKLLAPARGAPLLAHVLRSVSQAIARGGVLAGGLVVLPPDTPGREVLVRAASLEYAFTAGSVEGVSQSLRAGLDALAARHPDAQGALIFPGDQPEVSQDVVAALMGAWSGGSTPVIRPRYKAEPETPGHPVLLDRSVWPRATELQGDTGFVQLFRAHPDLVTTIDVPGTNPTINTPEDLARWESQVP